MREERCCVNMIVEGEGGVCVCAVAPVCVCVGGRVRVIGNLRIVPLPVSLANIITTTIPIVIPPLPTITTVISYYDREVVWARETHEGVVAKAMGGVGREAIRQIIAIIPVI